MAYKSGSGIDLNSALSDVIKRGNDMKTRLGELLGIYENLYRQSNDILSEERAAIPVGDTKTASELDDFSRLVLSVKRNRDIVGSMLRGVGGLRLLSEFKFVETEDAPKPQEKEKDKKSKKKSAGQVPMKQTSQAEQIAQDEFSNADVAAMDSLFDLDEEVTGGANA